MIIKILFAIIFSFILSGCGQPIQFQEIDPIQLQKVCEEEYSQKFFPDSYRPVQFDVGQSDSDNDRDQERAELYKLKDYKLISEKEFNEKLRDF